MAVATLAMCSDDERWCRSARASSSMCKGIGQRVALSGSSLASLFLPLLRRGVRLGRIFWECIGAACLFVAAYAQWGNNPLNCCLALASGSWWPFARTQWVAVGDSVGGRRLHTRCSGRWVTCWGRAVVLAAAGFVLSCYGDWAAFSIAVVYTFFVAISIAPATEDMQRVSCLADLHFARIMYNFPSFFRRAR